MTDQTQNQKPKEIDYPYYKNIKAPSQIGMSGKGTLNTLTKDINGLMEYVQLLVSGKSSASKTGQPLGNKFFLKTGGKCVATDTKQDVDRYFYINNVPTGNIPIISSGMDMNFSEFRGLIPGIITNLNAFDPFAIMSAFSEGTKPECQKITMQTIDIYNNKSTETNYVALADIKYIDNCLFPNKRNPITGEKCTEAFSNMELEPSELDSDDKLMQLYFGSLGLFGIYILYRLLNKSKYL